MLRKSSQADCRRLRATTERKLFLSWRFLFLWSGCENQIYTTFSRIVLEPKLAATRSRCHDFEQCISNSNDCGNLLNCFRLMQRSAQGDVRHAVCTTEQRKLAARTRLFAPVAGDYNPAISCKFWNPNIILNALALILQYMRKRAFPAPVLLDDCFDILNCRPGKTLVKQEFRFLLHAESILARR